MAYKRKTIDCYAIEGNCGYGWDIECNCEDFKDAKEQLKTYRKHVNYPVRIKKWREKINEWEILQIGVTTMTYTAQGVEIVHDNKSWDFMTHEQKLQFINEQSMETKANIIARKIKRNEKRGIVSAFRKKVN